MYDLFENSDNSDFKIPKKIEISFILNQDENNFVITTFKMIY